jgi:hypothetical protein
MIWSKQFQIKIVHYHIQVIDFLNICFCSLEDSWMAFLSCCDIMFFLVRMNHKLLKIHTIMSNDQNLYNNLFKMYSKNSKFNEGSFVYENFFLKKIAEISKIIWDKCGYFFISQVKEMTRYSLYCNKSENHFTIVISLFETMFPILWLS